MITRLLILSVSAGNGHVRAAEALAATAAAQPGAAEARHIDAMQHVASGFRAVYADGYLKLVDRYPELWSYVHQKTDRTPHAAPTQKLRRALERLGSGTLMKQVAAARPDAIVCTHFLPAELLLRERRRGRLACPVWLQVTDYDLHNMWVVPEMAGYFAANEEVAERMRARGLPPERVHVTGIPVMPAFADRADPALERGAAAAALGLDPVRPVVLIVSGGAGIGDLPAAVDRLLAVTEDFQLIAVAGRNAAAKAALDGRAAAQPGRLHAVGYTQRMHALMAAADLVITKPGGLTISECLAIGRPMLLVSPIPGQEEHNAVTMMEEGAAWLADDAIGLGYKFRRLLGDRARLAAMAARSRTIGRPGAAADVLRIVLGGPPA